MADEYQEDTDLNFRRRQNKEENKDKTGNKIMKILAYIALGSMSLLFMTIIAYYVAK